MVPSYPTSLLARRVELLKESFGDHHPHGWLVWEPRGWGGASDSLAETLKDLAAEPPETHPTAKDPLCYELAALSSILYLGRARESDIYVPDATVSRRHLALAWEGGWSIQSLYKRWPPASFLNGAPIDSIRWVRLLPTDKVRLGAAEFTYLESSGLIAWIAAQRGSTPPG
jgi:hypothetical protein